MTAPATTRRAGPFNGNGVTTSFPFTFKVFAATDVGVLKTATTSVESSLVLGSDYSITLNSDQDASPGGTITYPISGTPLAVGEKLTALGALPYDQTADLPTGGNYRARVIEDALDRTVFQVQQVAEELGRSLTLPASAATADTKLPVPEANKLLSWNASADALVNRSTADIATAAVYSNWRTDIFNGDGSDRAFSLAADPGNVNNTDVSISGVTQTPGVDYTVSGTTLTFTTAPPSGTGNVVCRYGLSQPSGVTSASAVSYAGGTVEEYLERVVYADDEGAVADGTADDAPAIQAALDKVAANPLGGTVWLTSGKKYRIKTKLNATASNCGLASDGTAQLVGSYLDFTNDTGAGRYGSTAAFVDLSGVTVSPYTPVTGTFCRGVRFLFEPPPNVLTGGTKRSVSGIIARNVIDVDISDNEMSGFMTGVGIRVATLTDGQIVGNYLHDFFDNNNWTGTPADAQITGIEMDNDRVNAVGSVGTKVHGNTVVNMECGAQSETTGGGYQSDGINVAGLGGDSPHSISVCNNTIRKCGEGIDHFGRNCTISGNVVSEVYTFGIKLIHGARHNVLEGNTIEKFGLAGLVMSGTTTAGADTEGNSVIGITISDGDYLGDWAANDSACIFFSDNGGTGGKPRRNLVTGAVLNEGDNCKNGWLDSSTGADNIGEGLRIIAGDANARRVLVTSGGGSCRLAGSGTYSTDLA